MRERLNATAAFFDLDRTLIARSSGQLYIQVLRERGLLNNRDLMKILGMSVLYKLKVLQPERMMERAAREYRGETERELVAFGYDWFDHTVKNYLYTEAIQKIRGHQAKGHTVALLTAAPAYVAEPTAQYLGIRHYLCSRMEVKDGRLTGRFLKPICHGRGKLQWALRFSRTNGLDLGRSYFYTDSIRDLPMLEAVGNPRPVNSDGSLLRIARKRGWPTLRFRVTLGKVETNQSLLSFFKASLDLTADMLDSLLP